MWQNYALHEVFLSICRLHVAIGQLVLVTICWSLFIRFISSCDTVNLLILIIILLTYF